MMHMRPETLPPRAGCQKNVLDNQLVRGMWIVKPYVSITCDFLDLGKGFAITGK